MSCSSDISKLGAPYCCSTSFKFVSKYSKKEHKRLKELLDKEVKKITGICLSTAKTQF